MHQSDIDDITRKLATLASKHGFAAIARRAPREKAKVIFDAFCWREEKVLNHTALFADSELSLVGSVAITTQFIEEARSKLKSSIDSKLR